MNPIRSWLEASQAKLRTAKAGAYDDLTHSPNNTTILAKGEPRMFKFLTCNRCGHKWLPRVKIPVRCPKCISQYWNKPRRRNRKPS